ncbi:MAG: CBS domain-containing protein [Deltaproteobacteria bacterium]|nr:CBS domain-containing protein [Deltaproteobacteria bacterium]
MRRLPIVDDFMDKSFNTVKPETRVHEAMDLMLKKQLIGVLVVDDQRQLVGAFSEKDCLKVLLQSGFHGMPDDTVENYMHTVPMTVDSRLDIIRVAQIFLANPFRRLAVVEEGKLVGQITRRDIVRGMTKYFE